MTAGRPSVQRSRRGARHHLAAVRQRSDRFARRPGGRDRRHDSGRVPGQVGPPRRAELGLARRRRGPRDDASRFSVIIQFGENTITGLARRSHRRRRLADRRRDRDDDGAVDEEGRRRRCRASCAAEMARALETGPLAVLTLAFLAVGREGVETALFMVGYAEAANRMAADRTAHRRTDRRRRSRTACTAARMTHQPRQVLQVHRRLPDPRRGGHPVLRRRRPADGRLAARPGAQGLRHQRLVQLVVLVRRAIQGIFNITPDPTVLQLDRAASAYLVVVLALFLRPTRAPAQNRSPNPSDPQPSTPKGPPRERFIASRRRGSRCCSPGA